MKDLKDFVGETCTPQILERIKFIGQSSNVRVTTPGGVLTCDFQFGRITVTVDEDNKIVFIDKEGGQSNGGW